MEKEIIVNYFKQNLYNKKVRFIIVGLLIAAMAGASYFVYDKFFAKKMVIASINPYSFIDTYIVDFFVDGKWGGNAPARTYGSRGVCCVIIPEKWRPGLVATVKWQKTEDPKWYTVQAEIPQYFKPAGLQVL